MTQPTLEQFAKSVAANLRAGGLTSAADCVEQAIAPAKPLIAAWNGRPFELKEGDRWNRNDLPTYWKIGPGVNHLLLVSLDEILGEYSADWFREEISKHEEFRPCDANGVRVPEWIHVKEGERWGYNPTECTFTVKPELVKPIEDDINANTSDWHRLDPTPAQPAEPKPMTAGELAVKELRLVIDSTYGTIGYAESNPAVTRSIPAYCAQGPLSARLIKLIDEECAKAAAEAVKVERERIAKDCKLLGTVWIEATVRNLTGAK